MKVILLKDVRGVGQGGEVKDVADGYAINALFPKKLAEPATEEKIKNIELKLKQKEEEAQKEQEQLTNKVLSLRGKRVAVAARATEKGGLFKAISAGDIIKAIRAEYSLEIPENAVYIPAPIKTIGEHPIALHSKTEKVELMVVVTIKDNTT